VELTARPRLELLEEPHVLHGDDALIVEGPEKRDLLLGEWPRIPGRVASTHGDHSDRTLPSHQRHHDAAAVTAHHGKAADRLGRVTPHVHVVDDLAFAD
jgi:hypothetical protein